MNKLNITLLIIVGILFFILGIKSTDKTSSQEHQHVFVLEEKWDCEVRTINQVTGDVHVGQGWVYVEKCKSCGERRAWISNGTHRDPYDINLIPEHKTETN